jgi:hypothetical protein
VRHPPAAIQRTIDAARTRGNGAIAYLPTGTCIVSDTLRIAGADYYVGGSGFRTCLCWKGPAGGTMVEVHDPQGITLEDIAIGNHDSGPMNNGIDVLQTSFGAAVLCRGNFRQIFPLRIAVKSKVSDISSPFLTPTANERATMKRFALSLPLLSLGLFSPGCQREPARQSASETKPAAGAPGERADEIPATAPKTAGKKADEGPVTVDGRSEVERLIAKLKDKDWFVRREAAEALGELGDKRAVEPLIAALPDWPIKDTIGTALKQLDGKPATDKQRFYCRVAARDNKGLLEDWKQTRQLILDDAGSQDTRKVQNAVYTVIALGKEEMVDDLARLLNSREEKDIAEVYLNCRHKGLSTAAGDWAARRGYDVPGGAGGSGPDWGRW